MTNTTTVSSLPGEVLTSKLFDEEPALLALLQLRSCLEEDLVAKLVATYAAFGRSEINKYKYQEEISRLCPSSAVFLWNRLVRSILYEDYKNEIAAAAATDDSDASDASNTLGEESNSSEDEEEDEEEDEHGTEESDLTIQIIDESDKIKDRLHKKKASSSPSAASDQPTKASTLARTSNAVTRKTKKKSKAKPESCSRIRNEWTPQEDRLFLEGLKRSSLNFREICKIIPNRTRSQIRTHYRYLARSLRENFANGLSETGGPYRRIKTRGRPPRGKPLPSPSILMLELKETIEQIENSNLFSFKSKTHESPSSS